MLLLNPSVAVQAAQVEHERHHQHGHGLGLGAVLLAPACVCMTRANARIHERMYRPHTYGRRVYTHTRTIYLFIYLSISIYIHIYIYIYMGVGFGFFSALPWSQLSLVIAGGGVLRIWGFFAGNGRSLMLSKLAVVWNWQKTLLFLLVLFLFSTPSTSHECPSGHKIRKLAVQVDRLDENGPAHNQHFLPLAWPKQPKGTIRASQHNR